MLPEKEEAEEWKMVKTLTGEWILSEALPLGRHGFKLMENIGSR